MNTKTLGRTGLQVSELALGGLFLTSQGEDYSRSHAAALRAFEMGVNYVDTAPGYGNSEETLGRILADVDKPVIISTKLGGRPQPFEPQDKGGLRQSVEQSLRALGRECIDILMIHEPDRPGQHDWWTDPVKLDGPVLELLDELKAEGKIRFSGLGGTTAYEMARLIRTGKFDVVLTAFNYSLLWREAELEVLPAAKEQGVGLVIGSPLQQGALAQRFDEQVREGAHWLSPPRRRQFLALYELLDEIGIPLPELALRFVLSNQDVSCVLTGARSQDEVEANVRAAEKGPLPAKLLSRLDEIAAQVPFRPFDEPAGLPFWRNNYKGAGAMR